MSLAASLDPVARAFHPPAGAGLSANAPRTAGSTAPRCVVVPHAARARAEHYRTNQRHTTHLDGFPPTVRIVLERHPFEGQALPLLGWMHRHGALELVLVLPDGTRRLIPATWTDLEPTQQPEAHSTATLGALADLLSAGRVVYRALP